MKNQKGIKTSMFMIGPASAADLASRQSVRATFRLSSDSLQAIQIVVKQLGIKPKSLFDHLLEDRDSIQKVAPRLRHTTFVSSDRVQKTFVISKKSLSFLDQAAHQYNASRDVLVESLVRRLLPVIAEEQSKHRLRKQVLGEVRDHFQSGKSLLNELGRTLGENDPFYNSMMSAMSNYYTALRDMNDLVEKGKGLEDFSPEKMADILTESLK